MSKTHMSETLNLASQTIPFLMITATFIIMAYVYGHSLTPTGLESPLEPESINFSHFL